MAVNKIPESQLPIRSVSDTDYVRIVGADGKSYRVPKTDFNGGGGGGSALTQDTKQALLQCFAHTAWTDDQGQDYYDDLEDALYPFDLLSSITAVYTQSGTVYDTDSLNSLKDDLVVTGYYSDSTYNQTTKYTLSGTLTVGTSTITVTYGGKTATFTVTVTQSQAVLTSISAVYTQSGTVYDTDSLDSLKADLVVTAHYSDSSTETVPSTDYTLSGTLTVGTSTVTVTYSEKATTFTVTVSEDYLNKMTYALTNDDVVKINGSASWDSTHDIFYSLVTATNRRSFWITQGVKAAKRYENNVYQDENTYFPIPVPSAATKVTVAITPSTQFIGLSLYTYDGTKYDRKIDDGWRQGSRTLTFNAEQYDFLTISSKYDSAGSSYPVEPTELTIIYE